MKSVDPEVTDTDSDQVRETRSQHSEASTTHGPRPRTQSARQRSKALQRLLGNTQEGQQIARLWRQSNELTELHNRGYKGGVSQYTDALSPLPSNTGYSDRALIELPTRLGITGAAAGVTGGASIPAQIGAVAAGRGIDALTGRRSAVAKFVKDQQARQGTADPTAQSIRASRALAKQQEEERRSRSEADSVIWQTSPHKAMHPPKGDPARHWNHQLASTVDGVARHP